MGLFKRDKKNGQQNMESATDSPKGRADGGNDAPNSLNREGEPEGVESKGAVNNDAESKEAGDKGAGKDWDFVYLFIPLFEQPVQMLPEEEIKSALSKKLGHMDASILPESDIVKNKGTLVWDLWDCLAYSPTEEKKYAPQLAISAPGAFNRQQWDEYTISQFWNCGEERVQFADRCRYSFVCSIMMKGRIPRKVLGPIIAAFADIMMELFPDCIGIFWPYSQNLVSREYFQGQNWSLPKLHFLDGGLNVRIFQVPNGKELLFDTLGLAAVGLPDLQICCKGLETKDVVMFLREMAAFLFTQGNVIKDGNTVEGINHQKWVCRQESSMAGPKRTVLNICQE